MERLSRRELLKRGLAASCSAVLAACAQPGPAPTAAPQVVEKTVEVVVTATPPPATAVPQVPKDKQMGGTLNVWLDSRWPETSWLHLSNWQSGYAIAPMAEVLFRPRTDGTLEPVLAEKYEASADGMTYTVHLREGVKWHDGQPFTANDVLYTYHALYRPDKRPLFPLRYGTTIRDLKSYSEGKVEEITGIQVVDDHTLRYTLDAPDASLPNLFFPVTVIVPKHALTELDEALLLTGTADYWYTKPIGTGPYKFVRYVTDQYIEFARNEDYWGGKVGPEKLFYKLAPPDVALVMLQKGELDVVPRVPLAEVERLRTLPGVEIVEAKQRGSFWGLEFNYETKDGFWRNPKAKQAFLYATNRAGYVASILKGYGTVPDSWFDGTPYACPTMTRYNYDPETAKKLFDEIGMTEDKRKQTTITLMSWLGMKDRQEFLPIAQENLRQLGFRVNVDIIDNALIIDYKSGRTGRDYDATVLAVGPGLDPGNIGAFVRSDSTSNFGARGQLGWWVNYQPVPGGWVYQNAKVDELLLQGQREVDPDKRMQIYQQIDCLWNEELPAITFAFASDILAKSERVQGVDWQNWAGFGLTTFPAAFRIGDWWVWQQ